MSLTPPVFVSINKNATLSLIASLSSFAITVGLAFLLHMTYLSLPDCNVSKDPCAPVYQIILIGLACACLVILTFYFLCVGLYLLITSLILTLQFTKNSCCQSRVAIAQLSLQDHYINMV